jgi:hypothetical protein
MSTNKSDDLASFSESREERHGGSSRFRSPAVVYGSRYLHEVDLVAEELERAASQLAVT